MTKKILFLIPLLFLACSKHPKKENLTALKWHQKIYKDIQNNDLDQADDDLLSLEAEHFNSIYIKTDLLNLYFAHLANEDFELAKFYLNQYEKRYATLEEIPWCEYQKIKVDFISYQRAYTDQAHILNLISECNLFLTRYPDSKFRYEVNTILAKAELTNKYLDAKISALYKKLDKPKAAKLYKVKIPKNSKPPKVPWYRKIFYW